MDPIVTTLLTPAAILAFVTIARNLGVPTKLAPILAIVLGVTLAVAEQQLGGLPIYQAAAGGLLLGLSASGVYDVAKLTGATRPAETDSTNERAPQNRAPIRAGWGALFCVQRWRFLFRHSSVRTLPSSTFRRGREGAVPSKVRAHMTIGGHEEAPASRSDKARSLMAGEDGGRVGL